MKRSRLFGNPDFPHRLSVAVLLCAGFAAVFAISGCSDDSDDDTKDQPADTAGTETDTKIGSDGASTGDAAGTTLDIPKGKHIGVDLAKHLPKLAGTGAYARKYEKKDAFVGSAAQARDGDWVIGNEHVRFAVQGPDRHIGVCPWGGNLIDGSAKRADGTWSDDEMGEQCLLYNLGRTMRGTDIEVLADGSKGVAVLAVTGKDELLDFINLPSMIANFPGFGDADLPLDPDAKVPLTITRYFILGANEKALRVVTGLRNDGDKDVIIGTGELIDSGGEVEFFNPASSNKGFGSGGFGAQQLDFIAFHSPRGGHLYAPPPIKFGPGAGYLAVGGAAGILTGGNNLLTLLLGGKAVFEKSQAALKIKSKSTVVKTHLVSVSTGILDSMTAPIWKARGKKLVTLSGKAVDASGKPVVGARISALRKGATQTQTVSGKDGSFSMTIFDATSWSVLAWHAGYGLSKSIKLAAAKFGKDGGNGKVDAGPVTFGNSGMLNVKVTGSDGKASPAKLTVYCAKECPEIPQTVRDAGGDKPGSGVLLARFIGVEGKLDQPLPVGDYRIVVTRGPTRSIWPDATSGGKAVTIAAGKSVAIDAVVRDAIDTSGWLSGDFHVHSVNSPDAAVENRRRVRTFLAEGVDVLVPTDHDYVTDMKPHIAAEKADKLLATLPGVELTTFDYGHFNAFPLKVDSKDLNGAAVDWAGGDGPGMDPPAIVEALKKKGAYGVPVVQINHPNSYLGTLQVDILGGISLRPREGFRVTDKATDPKTGDTGMYTDKFTAIEILTGHRGGGFGGDSFGTRINWWFTLLSRGVKWTGTATSDTHRTLSSQSGGSRTYVFVGKGKDTPATFDAKEFGAQVNAGRAVGSDGPFVVMKATSGKDSAAIGETLAHNGATVDLGGTVTVTVSVQAPAWMDLSRVELFVNATKTYAPVGEDINEIPKPHAVHTFDLTKLKPVAGKDPKTKRWQLDAVFTLKGLKKDAWVVAMVHGDKAMPKALYGGRTVKPLAFTNPIYLDADGGGYNNTPLQKKVQPKIKKPAPPPPGKPTAAMWREVIEAIGGHKH